MDTAAAGAMKEVESELLPVLQVYKDGTVHRLLGSPFVPPSAQDPETQVASKDITISHSPPISARLYLPPHHHHQKHPILLYFHGGAFCIESAFSAINSRYINVLSSLSAAIVVSLEYRLAPEHPLPAAYQDAWSALLWLASHSISTSSSELTTDPWLTQHGDFSRVYIGGDSSGANIAHNIAMRVGSEVEGLPGGLRVLGAMLGNPFFWGSEPVGSEPREGREEEFSARVWRLVYPSAAGGVDHPALNPVAPGAPSLRGLGCERLLVCIAGEDGLKDRNRGYVERVRESGWGGEVEVFEMEGEGHAFHVFNPRSDNAMVLIKRLAQFLQMQ